MSKKQDASALEVVYEYMKKQNRPYSLVDIFNNLHKEHGKTAVQKAIDQLVSNGKLCEKVYGKQKVYVVNQDCFEAANDAELKTMDLKIVEQNACLSDTQKELREAESQLSQLNSSLGTKEAQSLLKQTQEEVEQLRLRIKCLAENPNQVTAEEKERVCRDREKYIKEWRKRKRTTNDILDSILEGYPKNKKCLYEEVGIETDESVGVTVLK